jgi:hypothetical protein
VNNWRTFYRVARSFKWGARTFSKGEIVRADDPIDRARAALETFGRGVPPSAKRKTSRCDEKTPPEQGFPFHRGAEI